VIRSTPTLANAALRARSFVGWITAMISLIFLAMAESLGLTINKYQALGWPQV
jgi:hypothetical protein